MVYISLSLRKIDTTSLPTTVLDRYTDARRSKKDVVNHLDEGGEKDRRKDFVPDELPPERREE